MPQTYAETVAAQNYEEARREHNVCALGNGENPHPPTYGGAALCVSCPASGTADCASCVDIQPDFVPFTTKPSWMAEGVWALDQALQTVDIPFDGSVIPSNDEPTSQIADSRDAAF